MRRQILIGLFLLAFLCVAPGFAQEEAKPEKKQVGAEQYKAVCKANFVGEPLSLSIVNADIRDILKYITKEYGYDFVLDNSVGRKVTTVNVDGVAWNVALNNILEPEDLTMECGERSLRIKAVAPPEKEPETAAIYTEFIKLKKLPVCPNKNKCEQLSLALNRLKTTVTPRLSKSGLIEIDESSQTLIITDARDNLNALISFVEILDNEEFYKDAEKGK